MSQKLSFSIMSHNPEFKEILSSTLSGFQASNGLDINIREIDYASGWSEFVRTSIYGSGLDLSEIGTTWVNDFAAMQGLRAYTPSELRVFGGEGNFPPALWHSIIDREGNVCGVPWMTDVSLVYYRRDHLQAAGVEEGKAFSTPAEFDHSLYRLQRSGVGSPLVLPTRHSHITIHNIAMWLWAFGIDFLSATGKEVVLNEPAACAALRSYFSLYHYLSPSARRLNSNSADNLFASGGASVAISGPWLLPYLEPEVRDNLGLAIPFGQSYLGGSAIVAWKSTEKSHAVLQLVEKLMARDVQMVFPRKIGLLPARLDVIQSLVQAEDASAPKIFLDALQNGRALPSLPIWGLVEDRLASTFEHFWDDLLSDPSPQIDRMMDERLTPDFRRLGLVISNY